VLIRTQASGCYAAHGPGWIGARFRRFGPELPASLAWSAQSGIHPETELVRARSVTAAPVRTTRAMATTSRSQLSGSARSSSSAPQMVRRAIRASRSRSAVGVRGMTPRSSPGRGVSRPGNASTRSPSWFGPIALQAALVGQPGVFRAERGTELVKRGRILPLDESQEQGWCERGILLDEDREFVT
jgi:hypothetical protein